MDHHYPVSTPFSQQREILDKHIADLRLSLRSSEGQVVSSECIFEDTLGQFLNQKVVGIYRSTVAGKLVVANMALARIFGYGSPEEMLKCVTDIRKQLYAHPAQRTAWRKLFQQQENVGPFVWQGNQRNESRVWVEEHARAIRDEHGGIWGYEGVVVDVTARNTQELKSQRVQKKIETIEKSEADDRVQSNEQLRSALGDAQQTIAILREQLDRFEMATVGSQEGLWEGRPLSGQPWNSPETPVWYSAQFKALLGFEEHEFPPVLESWGSRIHPDDRDRVFQALKDHIENHAPYDLESRLRTKQGEYRWFKGKGQAIYDTQGTFVRGSGTIRDITAQKAAEDALKREHVLLTTVVEGTSDIIFVKDLDGRYLLVNSTGAALLGRQIEEVIGRTDVELFPKGVHPLFTKYSDDVIREKTPHSFEIDVEDAGVVSRTFLVTKEIFSLTGEGLEGLFCIARDITFRKAEELTIQERERRYRAIMENAYDLIAEVNEEGQFLYVSPNYKEVLGFSPKELLGSNIFALVHSDDRPAVIAEFQRSMESEGSGQSVCRYRGLQGEYRWFESTGRVFRTALGERRGVVISRDITRRKQADDALEAIVKGHVIPGSPNFFEILVEELAKVLNVPMVLLFECLEGSHGKAKILAFWNHDHFEPPSGYDCLGGPCERVLEGYPVEYPFGAQALFPDSGTLKTFDVEAYFGFPLINSRKEVVGNFAIMDIQPLLLSAQGKYLLEIFAARAGTELERKRAQEDLENSQIQYRGLYDQTPLIYLTVNPQGTILSVNHYGATLLGYAIKELLGTAVFSVVHPEDRGLFQSSIQKNMQGATKGAIAEYRNVKKNGTILWVKATIQAPDQFPGPRVLLLSCEDITERKQAEAALAISEQQLRHTQKMEAIGTLAGGIAHDFNNILGAILGYSELALTQAKQEPKLTSYLGEVLTAGHRAKELVKQILAFSRRSDHEREAVDLNVMVQEALRMVRATLPTTIDIRSTFTMDSAVVFADSTQMHQVIMNLCANAEQAMREHGGVLSLMVSSTEVAEPSSQEFPELNPGTYLQLLIQDTGQGMSRDVLERIFEPFFTTKALGEGTGLGLAVVHGIIVGHGGHIAVSSEIGQGTTFTILLPRLDVVLPDQSPNALDCPQGTGRVLFVDDEDVLARWGEQVLTHLGYTVVAKTNPHEAVELFRSQPYQFDIVVTDQTMPTMSGETFAKTLLEIRPDVAIVLCTGFSHTMSEEKAKQLGIKGFLMKPVNGDLLAKTLQDLLGDSPGQSGQNV
ncbi:MAG: PAS domain S-box protein [Nitrospirales bacterium]